MLQAKALYIETEICVSVIQGNPQGMQLQRRPKTSQIERIMEDDAVFT